MLGAFTATDEDPAAKETIEGVLKELGSLDQGVTLSAGDMMGGRGLEVTLSKDPAKVADARLRLFKALTKTGTYISFPLKEKPEVRESAEKAGGFTLHAVKMKFDFDKAVAEQPEETRELAKTAMKRVLGGE